MLTFALGLVQTAIDQGANSDEVLEAYSKLRAHIGNRGGNLRPVNEDDYNETFE